MFSIVFVVTLVSGTIFPFEYTTTFHFAFVKCSLVLSLGQSQSALPLEKIIFKVSVIGDSVWKLIRPFPMFSPIQKLTFVHSPIFPSLLALSIRQITKPLPRIGVVFDVINQSSSSLCYIMSNLSLIVTAPTKYVTSISMSKTICE